jgi:hypothetical protein
MISRRKRHLELAYIHAVGHPLGGSRQRTCCRKPLTTAGGQPALTGVENPHNPRGRVSKELKFFETLPGEFPEKDLVLLTFP